MRALQIGIIAVAGIVSAPHMLANNGHFGGHDRGNRIFTRLSGFNETPQTLSTPASGEFKAKITRENTIEFELRFRNLESNVTQAHIHFGAPGLQGGIAVWLCGTTAAPGPAGTESCGEGQTAGIITGTITAADVIGPAGQGIAVGEFEELLDAIDAGASYANVHSVNRGGGEIRGRLE